MGADKKEIKEDGELDDLQLKNICKIKKIATLDVYNTVMTEKPLELKVTVPFRK